MIIDEKWILDILKDRGVNDATLLNFSDISDWDIQDRNLPISYQTKSGLENIELDIVDVFKFQTHKAFQNFEKLEQNTNEPLLSKWILDNVEHVIKNYIAMCVYENTLSHQITLYEDWAIDIKFNGPNEKGWQTDWVVTLDNSKQRIEGSFTITFQELVAECMKAGLNR